MPNAESRAFARGYFYAVSALVRMNGGTAETFARDLFHAGGDPTLAAPDDQTVFIEAGLMSDPFTSPSVTSIHSDEKNLANTAPSSEPTITVYDGNGGNPKKLTKAQYLELCASGMMWEFHPDAPLNWPHP